MAAKLCKYCNVQMLDGFDEVERKFFEQGTRILHTRERCEAIRNSPDNQGPKYKTTGSAGIEQLTAMAVMLENMKTQIEGMELKVDKALQLLQGQNTLEGSD